MAVKCVMTKSALAGVLLLQAYSFAPEPHARVELSPDSIARAVANRNMLLLEHSFAEGVNVNGAGADGRTALLIATLQVDRELIQRLLEAGANVDLADQSGTTPIMVAAEHGDVQLLRSFLSRSTKPDTTDASGRSAIRRALEHSQYALAELLVPLVAAVDTPGPDGRDLVITARHLPEFEPCDLGELVDLAIPAGAQVTKRIDWNIRYGICRRGARGCEMMRQFDRGAIRHTEGSRFRLDTEHAVPRERLALKTMKILRREFAGFVHDALLIRLRRMNVERKHRRGKNFVRELDAVGEPDARD